MIRQEKTFFPRKKRAPYFGNPNASVSLSDDNALPSTPAAATTFAGANINTPASHTEGDSGSNFARSPSALRPIASLSRLPRMASETTGKAAVMPTNRRSEANFLLLQDESSDHPHNDSIRNDKRNHSSSYTPESTKGGGNNATIPPAPPSSLHTIITPDWRLRVRMRTVGVGLVLALNIGTDPPDTIKPHPCASLLCWMDPATVSRSKARESIGERLEQQYAVWQLARTARPLRYRRALDPTVDDVRNLCVQLRRQARNEYVVLATAVPYQLCCRSVAAWFVPAMPRLICGSYKISP